MPVVGYDSKMIRRQFLQTAGAIGLSIPRRSPGQSPEPGTFTYKTAAGCEIRADVYGGAPGASRPAVMWMHGGALIFGNRKSLTRPFHAGLLQLGYVIVSIDYRLAPETKLPAIIEVFRTRRVLSPSAAGVQGRGLHRGG